MEGPLAQAHAAMTLTQNNFLYVQLAVNNVVDSVVRRRPQSDLSFILQKKLFLKGFELILLLGKLF